MGREEFPSALRFSIDRSASRVPKFQRGCSATADRRGNLAPERAGSLMKVFDHGERMDRLRDGSGGDRDQEPRRIGRRDHIHDRQVAEHVIRLFSQQLIQGDGNLSAKLASFSRSHPS